MAPPEVAFGCCCIGGKAEVYDAELHAIQEGLSFLVTSPWPPGQVLICAGNQAALLTLYGWQPGRVRVCLPRAAYGGRSPGDGLAGLRTLDTSAPRDTGQ